MIQESMRLLVCTQALDRADPVLGFFHRWLEELAKDTERLTVVCLRKGHYDLPENVTVLSLGQAPRLVRAWRLVRESITHRHQYDAVLVHMNPEYLLVAGMLWRLMGKRVGLWYEHKNVTSRLRIAVWFVDVVFSASKEGFRLHTKKLQVVGHGIDTTRVVPPRTPSHGVARLITVGRIAPIKHIETIIDAWLILKKRSVSSTLAVYGAPATPSDRTYQERLRSSLTASGEDPNEVLKGAVPHADLPKRRAHADYLLHASETGSLDKSVLDAILSGVIPISASSAYKELFKGYEHLLFYPVGEATALAERVVVLEALSEEEREALRITLRERVVDKHSLERLIPRILSILSEPSTPRTP